MLILPACCYEKRHRIMRFAIECFQIGKCLRGLRTLFVRLCAVKRAPLIQCGERTSQRYKCLDGRRAALNASKASLPLYATVHQSEYAAVNRQLFQHGTHGSISFRLVQWF